MTTVEQEPGLRPLSASQMEALEEAVSKYSAAHTDESVAYLRGRGIDRAEAALHRLGVVADPLPGHARYQGMLAIPYLLADGSPVQIRFRCMEQHDHRAFYHGKYNTVAGDPARLYNVSAIMRPGNEIHITEGECFRGDAEVLTRKGWVRFDEYNPGDEVAQWEFDGTVRFVRPEAYVKKEYKGDLIRRSNRQRYVSLTTPGHRVPAFGGKRDPFAFVTAEDGAPVARHIPRAGRVDGKGIPYSTDELMLALAISADATIRVSGAPRNPAKPDGPKWEYGRGHTYVHLSFVKVRKAERLALLLDRLGIEYHSARSGDGRCFNYSFHLPEKYHSFGRILPMEWLTEGSRDQLEFMLAELREWDGNGVPNRTQEEYSSKHYANAVWVQTLCHLTGRVSTIMHRSNAHGEWYKVSILHGKDRTSWQSLRDAERLEHDGLVYCVKVPSSALLVRMDESISVSGNCDAIILNKIGLNAVAAPGAKAWKGHHRRMMLGFERIYVWADPDEAGAEMVQTLTRSLPRSVPMRLTAGDVTDTYMQGGKDALMEIYNTYKKE